MTDKHTPGPWRVSGCRMKNLDEHDNYLVEHGDEGTGSPLIAEVYTDSNRLPVEANARLIAAAPELLKALETLLMGYDSLGEHEPVSNLIAGARMARDAIKAAMGDA